MSQDPTESISTATLNNNSTPFGGQSLESLLHNVVLVILLTCVLWNTWRLFSTVTILIDSLDLFSSMSLQTFSRLDDRAGASSGKQQDLAENSTSHSWQDHNARHISQPL